MTISVLYPVDQSAVQPCLSVEDVIEEFLGAAGAPRNGINWASIENTDDGIHFTASSRPTFNPDDISAAARVLIDSLYEGRINAYVRDDNDREYYRLRRDYWQDLEYADIACVKVIPPFSVRDGDWNAGVLDQPILIPQSEFDSWKRQGLIAFGVVSAAPPVSEKKVRQWVEQMVQEKKPKSFVEDAAVLKAAFPKFRPPSRRMVRDLYDTAWQQIHGTPIRSGPRPPGTQLD